MKYILLLPALLIALLSVSLGQPGTVQMTPAADLHLKPQRLQVPAKFRGRIDTNFTVNLPEGYVARVFHIGSLSGARFLTWGPDSVLYVSSAGSSLIMALPDRDHDGVADTIIVAATNATGHDLVFYNGAMYVDGSNQILKYTDGNGDGIYETREQFISGLPSGGNHPRHSIEFDPVRRKFYVTVGSSCNVCREADRGIILEYNDDGTGKRVYAKGTRNPMGLNVHPRTGRLWTTNNGSDAQGNNTPPEWIDLVRENGFYGYPFVYGNQVYFNYGASAPGDYRALLPITSSDTALIQTMVQPAALVLAHSAPMQMSFANESFGETFGHGAFLALHGSWNRTPASGHKIVYLDFDNDNDTTANSVADFMTGFMTDSSSSNPQRWARPVGIAVDNRGNLYVGSDANQQFIAIISPASATTGVQPEQPVAGAGAGFTLLQNVPNPVRSTTTIGFTLRQRDHITLRLFNPLGDLVATVADATYDAGTHTVEFNASSLPSGTYYYRMQAGVWEGERVLIISH